MKRILTRILNKATGKTYIRLNRVCVRGSVLTYEYSVSTDIKHLFKDNEFSIDYGFSLAGIPESILAIPFVTNTLPIAWITNATLAVPVLDQSFCDSVEAIKRGYETIHPALNFQGKLVAKKKERNNWDGNKTAMAFSGGADSYGTLFNHISESPMLVTLVGSDIFFDDSEGIEQIRSDTKAAANKYGLPYSFVSSKFRYFLDQAALDDIVEPYIGDGWWHGLQHGIGIIGHVAPLAYRDNLQTFYFASTYTQVEFDKGLSMASYPVTDGNVRIGSMHVVHDGFEFSRQEKMRNICQYVKSTGQPVSLRVCWKSKGGKNCSRCEKCYRTIVALMVEGANPEEYNFEIGDGLADRVRDMMKREVMGDDIVLAWWRQIQAVARQKAEYVRSEHPTLSWLIDADL